MKIRLRDRLMAGLIGFLFILAALAVAVEGYTNPSLIAGIASRLASRTALWTIVRVAMVALSLAISVWCVLLAFRREQKKDFVTQRTDGGELSIAISAIEHLVQQCVDTHAEIQMSDMKVKSHRDGVRILLSISLGSGVSIPLAVTALQKQIEQYVTECTGVEVWEVCVQVDSTSAENVAPSVYQVREGLTQTPQEERTEMPEPVVTQEEEKQNARRPLRQRLFRHDDEMTIVPEPPKTESEAPDEDAALPPVTDMAAASDDAPNETAAQDSISDAEPSTDETTEEHAATADSAQDEAVEAEVQA